MFFTNESDSTSASALTVASRCSRIRPPGLTIAAGVAPSASAAGITSWERALGMPIFDRSTAPLRLTEFGKLYIKAIEDVREIERGLVTYISDTTTLRVGEVSIGASNVFAAYTLPPIIAAFKERYPDIRINLIEGNTEMLESLLSENRVDLVIDNNRYDAGLYERDLTPRSAFCLPYPRFFPNVKKQARMLLTGSASDRGAIGMGTALLSHSLPFLPFPSSCSHRGTTPASGGTKCARRRASTPALPLRFISRQRRI